MTGKDIGACIRAWRVHRGWSQVQMVDRVWPLNPEYRARLSRYENGHTVPSLSALQTIGKGLNVPLDALLSLPSDTNPGHAAVTMECLADVGKLTKRRAKSFKAEILAIAQKVVKEKAIC